MNLLDKIELIERVDSLIMRKGTGTPSSLADRLGVSSRTIYYLINMMKELGAPIYYCKIRSSYCYREDVFFSIGFKLQRDVQSLAEER